MSYRPDESTLIAYLYGELNEKETQKLEGYFQQHPEELTKLRELGEVRDLMSHAQDKEVIAPPVFVDDTNIRPLWKSSSIRFAVGMTASILFLLVAGKLLGPEINYSKGELRISFGEKTEQVEPVNNLTEEKVNDLITTSLTKNNETLASARNEDQKKYMENLLVDFSGYLQEQRKQDLQYVQAKVNSLEKNNNQFKQETEQILTSLISNPGKKKNSY